MPDGQFIRDMRISLDISQAELSRKCGVSQQRINDIEHMRISLPKVDSFLIKMGNALNYSNEYLLYKAGKFPLDLRENLTLEQFEKGIKAFRKAIK